LLFFIVFKSGLTYAVDLSTNEFLEQSKLYLCDFYQGILKRALLQLLLTNNTTVHT